MSKGRRRKEEGRRRRWSLLLAIAISRVLDPVWLIPLMLAAAAGWSLFNGLRFRFILILLFIDGIIPGAYFIHLLATKQISDWDTTRRRQRLKLYAFTVAVHLVGVVLAVLVGKPVLAKILLAFWLLALTYSLVTLVWKISLHTGVLSAAIAFGAYSFSARWWWGLVLLLVVAWSRVKLKKHTWLQTIVGAALAPVILGLSFYLLGVGPRDARSPSQIGLFN